MSKNYGIWALLAAFVLLAAGYVNRATASDEISPAALKMFAPLPETIPSASGVPTEAQISLGRMLYFDPRLSKDQAISCNTCHPLASYGMDGQPTSKGYLGQHGKRNAPSVYNAAGHFAQFWDGRAADVEEQAKGPVRNPIEMAMTSERDVIAVLESMPEYVAAFQRAFPQDPAPVCLDNLGIAIGAFERKLLTPGRWDRFLRGDPAALTAGEKTGLQTFLASGCQSCHSGAYLGGSSFQELGVAKPYPDTSDPGRFNVTGNEADRMFFKVPSLRNIAMTGPYFHNGKVTSLAEAVAQMAEYQRGKQLTERQIGEIVTFLGALTGELPAEFIREPVLPKSTAATPRPETGD